MNLDIFCDPNVQLDDKLFSPLHKHLLPEFYYQSNNESDGHCGLQPQYGTNEMNISDFFDSVINWDEIPYDESSSQMTNSAWFDVKGNGSWNNSNVELANAMVSDSFVPIYLLVSLGSVTKLMC